MLPSRGQGNNSPIYFGIGMTLRAVPNRRRRQIAHEPEGNARADHFTYLAQLALRRGTCSRVSPRREDKHASRRDAATHCTPFRLSIRFLCRLASSFAAHVKLPGTRGRADETRVAAEACEFDARTGRGHRQGQLLHMAADLDQKPLP